MGRSCLIFESEAQRHANMATHQKPEGMSWEDYADVNRPGYWDSCHWYDGEHGVGNGGHCRGDFYHNHQPVIYQMYWDRRTWVFAVPLVIIATFTEWLVDTRLWKRFT